MPLTGNNYHSGAPSTVAVQGVDARSARLSPTLVSDTRFQQRRETLLHPTGCDCNFALDTEFR